MCVKAKYIKETAAGPIKKIEMHKVCKLLPLMNLEKHYLNKFDINTGTDREPSINA